MRDLVGPPSCATRVRDYGAPQVFHASPRGSFAAPRLASLASPSVARHGALASLAVHGVVRRPPSTVGRSARHMARLASAALVAFLVIACTSLMIVARTEKPAPQRELSRGFCSLPRVLSTEPSWCSKFLTCHWLSLYWFFFSFFL